MSEFVHWYNNVHRHSGIKHVTPAERHDGIDKVILERRTDLYEQARKLNPDRWSGKTRNWEWIDQVWLNPENPNRELRRSEKMAA